MRLDRPDPLARLLLRTPIGTLVRWVARARTSVQRKLLAAFLLITLLFLAMGAFSVHTVRSMSHQSELLDEAHQRVEWAQQIHHSLAMQMHLTAMALLVREEAALAPILRENNRFSEALARLEEAVEAPERMVIQKIRAGQEEAMTIVADIANLVRDGKVDAATRLHSSREDPLYRPIDALAYELVEKENARMVALRSSIQAANQRSLVVLGSFAAVSVLLALAGGFIISWALIIPVYRAHDFLSELASGRFGASVTVDNREANGRLTLVFKVRKGPLYRVAAEGVEISGNKAVPTPEMRCEPEPAVIYAVICAMATGCFRRMKQSGGGLRPCFPRCSCSRIRVWCASSRPTARRSIT